MIYKIDGVLVNDRIDWRHRIVPSRPQSRRREQFAGIPELIEVKGPQMPTSAVVVTGHLEGTGATAEAAVTAVMTAIETAAAMQASAATKTITIHTKTYSNCVLANFEVLSAEPIAVAMSDGTAKVLELVRYTWTPLSS